MLDWIPKSEFSAIMVLVVETAMIIVLLIVLQHLIYRYINRHFAEVEQRHQIRGWARVVIYLLTIIVIVGFWLPSGQSAMQVLALLTAALTLTLSHPITSVLAWLVIMIDRPFGIGDRIEINDISGDVVDISLLHTHLLETRNWVDADQSTGRIVHLPNRFIFDEALFNASEETDLIWNELHFVVTHDSDWEEARDLILAQAEPLYEQLEQHIDVATDKIAHHYAYRRGITTPFVYVKLLRDGIKLSLRYMCKLRTRRGTAHQITIGFLHAIRSQPNINVKLAAPGYRLVLEESQKEPVVTTSVVQTEG